MIGDLTLFYTSDVRIFVEFSQSHFMDKYWFSTVKCRDDYFFWKSCIDENQRRNLNLFSNYWDLISKNVRNFYNKRKKQTKNVDFSTMSITHRGSAMAKVLHFGKTGGLWVRIPEQRAKYFSWTIWREILKLLNGNDLLPLYWWQGIIDGIALLKKAFHIFRSYV